MGEEAGEKKIVIRISEDEMQAYMTVYPPKPGEPDIGENALTEELFANGIIEGVKHDVIEAILKDKAYNREFLVAEGKPSIDGKSGEFEFFFNRFIDRRPQIQKDGSVDYSSMREVESVEAGQEIIRYTPAGSGQEGITVTGRVLSAKAGKELPQIKGKGFTVTQDKRTYIANISGKIEFESDRLVITNMLVVEGDVSIITGNIEFAGDINVKGNVVNGMTVTAKGNGSITVDGHVEGALLIAGRDVILKNGMQGSGKGEIRAGGDVSGKFFEQTTIFARGNVKANAILHCHIISEQEIIVSGKRGVLIGGSVSAIKKVEATIVGNLSETKTLVNLGVDDEVYDHLTKITEKVSKITEEVKNYEKAMIQINKILEKGNQPELASKKLLLMREKINKDARLTDMNEDIRRTKEKIENSQGARLIVRKSIYRGAKVVINRVQRVIESENYNVTYVKENGEITFKPNI